jgi:WD repeat-containing protein 76
MADRTLRIWDARKLHVLAGNKPVEAASAGRRSARTADDYEPRNFLYEEVTKFAGSREGKGIVRGEWRHGRAVGSAYWDPHGRRIVSTCYDNLLRGKRGVCQLDARG